MCHVGIVGQISTLFSVCYSLQKKIALNIFTQEYIAKSVKNEVL